MLRGGCACGRNEFIILVPIASVHEIQVLLDNSSRTRHHTTSPFTPFLRVPLHWYHSVTYAFFPDETHRSIRRTFSSPDDGPQTLRHFCGFCGTPLTCWNERTADNARHIEINLGSLVDEDVRRLQSWSLLRTEDDDELDEDEDADPEQLIETGPEPVRPVRGMIHRGMPWFESMIENSALGRVRRQKGGYEAPDGSESVYWEIVELAPDGSELPVETSSTPGNGKRKRGAGDEDIGIGSSGDVHMRG
ncbi:hypothetical protein NA57DRAFT_37267 [Rhizodiscina lignyota]|uniref:CENP-V/GFA domain-containing protein n=1 Tax=Rhizodiscina lignyota TaxID=1504668 RepID=A0A9P4IKH3_9PEZI|nr:hypothetical protein NA57DRAFT_37267 [Rhizodiscina lignyota]